MILQINRVVPESIRWLITEKRYSEARLLILEAARMNKKTVPNHLIFFEKAKHGDVLLTLNSDNFYSVTLIKIRCNHVNVIFSPDRWPRSRS